MSVYFDHRDIRIEGANELKKRYSYRKRNKQHMAPSVFVYAARSSYVLAYDSLLLFLYLYGFELAALVQKLSFLLDIGRKK